MRVLSIIHGRNAHSGIFGDAVREAGHELDERSFALGNPLTDPPDSYDAAMVFGGSMNVHEIEANPWIVDETRAIGRLLEEGVPLLGVCLGSQLLSSVAGGEVTRAAEPEIGWYDVELTADGAGDPVFGDAPARFRAFQWHSYASTVPAGGVLLAESPVCVQGFRIGDAWGMQFHAEVTTAIVESWIRNYESDPDAIRLGFEPQGAQRRLHAEIGAWNGVGRTLVDGFTRFAADRVGATSATA